MHFYEQKFAYLIFLLYLCLAKVLQNQLLTNKFKIMKKILTLFTALILFGSIMVHATDYYYRGNQNNWSAAIKMTPSTDGYYAYFSAKSYANNGNSNNNFKIALTTDSWDYNSSYVTRGFNGTDIKNSEGDKSIGLNWDNDNICVYCTSDFYILVYFPNTDINTTSNPIICASTSLPDDGDPAAPSVAFVGVPAEVYKGQTVTFAATSENVDNPVYSYLVDGVAATSSYTFNVAGSHTVTVEVRSNGTGDATTANMTVDCKEYSLMANDHATKGSKVADCTTSDGITFTATWNCIEEGTYYFYVTTNTSADANTNCDYLCSGQTLTNGVDKAAYLYGTSNYGDSYALNATVTGEYTFTLTLGANNYFRCDFPAAAPEPDCFVAGSITDIFGSPAWKADQEDNKMTWDEGLSLYTKSFTVDKAYKSVALKVVYGGEWYGDNGDNVKFSLSGAGTFTVKFNKTSHAISVEGDIVGDEQFDFNYVTVAGNGAEGNSWLNSEDWNAAAEANRMTEVETDIYEISYSAVKGVESKFQFTFDGGWTYQIGGTFSEFGTPTAAVFGNKDITFTPAEGADVTIRLNLSAFNFATKEGATFTVSQVGPVKIKGTVVNGSWEEDPLDFVIANNKESASLTIAIPQPGSYDFKMIIGDNQWRSNGYTYHRDYTAAAHINGNNDANMVLEADVAGDYTFTWTFENDSLNIAFPECDYYIKNNWYGCGAWKWKGMTPAAGGTYRIENVVYGGNGVNYNTTNDDAGATWKAQSVLFYMEGGKKKGVTAYDTVNFVLNPATDTVGAEMVSKDVTVYTVGSNSLALCDLGWAATHPHKYTDMKKQEDGTYKWTKSDEEVVLLAGDVYIKVFKDRDEANGYWPTTEEGKPCNIAQSGIYTIEVDFNPCTHDITITPTLVKALNIQNLILQGSWDQKPLVLDGNNAKALATLPLTVGTHNFQLLDGGNNKYGDGEAFTREHNSYREIVPKAGSDMTIEVDEAGEYLFTYIFETNQLVVSYPAIVPVDRISPIGGKFTINAKGDTAIFARGNLQYNYGANAWYAAEKQYEVLSDLNLRFGDDNYEGSVDVFGWSCDDSNYGLLKSNLDADFTGDFVDWGTKFTDDEKVWNTLTRGEWDFLLNRTKNAHKLWAIIALGPDSLNGLALFPDDWEDLAGLTIAYGYFDLDDEVTHKANSFSFAQWDVMEVAGAVFLPLAGARAGFVGNTTGIDGKTTTTKNPLSGWYCWMDNVSEYGFYWLATNPAGKLDEADMLVAPWLNSTETEYTRPVTTTRPRRYGHAVRLVTRIPKAEYVDVRTGLNAGHYYTVCWNKTMSAIKGASLWSFIGKDVNFAYIQEESAPYPAGKPYIVYAESEKLEAILTGDAVDETALVANNGLHGTFSALGQADLDGKKAAAGDHDVYLVIGDELRRATGYALDGNTPLAGNSLPAFRAYVVLDEITGGTPNQAPGKNVRNMPLHKDATQGFENLEGGEKPIKVLIDGQLYILRGENVYNVNGQIVQ